MKQYKKIIIAVVVTAFIGGGLIWIAKPGLKESSDLRSNQIPSGLKQGNVVSEMGNAIFAEEHQFDFGKISMAAGKVVHTFKIKNVHTDPVVVTKLYTSCMCTTALWITEAGKKGPFGMPGHGFTPKIKESLAPGEEAAIEVIFDPAAHGPSGIGRVERTVYVESESASLLQLGITATVIP